MTGWELHIRGRVQGVGFRPLVYRLAHAAGLTGRVSNGVDGLRVQFSAGPEQARVFATTVAEQAPRLAVITGSSLQEISDLSHVDFQIAESPLDGTPDLHLSPDFALCGDCRRELYAPDDRRRAYAFTTCTNCGPRYSITSALPYDRPRTTMSTFAMCPACRAEYNDPGNRRHFSQTNSCPDCRVNLLTASGGAGTQDAMINETATAIRRGEIVAIKGVGGFLLVCAAHNQDAVARLRQRKHRPDKPLAVMYPNLDRLRQDFHLSPVEAGALESPAAPIVLLWPRQRYYPLIAPALDRVGVVLPYAPVFDLLLAELGAPIVATSGNRSGEPIAFRQSEVIPQLGQVADRYLGNDREILLPQDDSVVAFTAGGRRIVHRRSRGMAPSFFGGSALVPQTVFAAGGELKASCGLQLRGTTYLSQYLGDLESFTAQENYSLVRDHLLTVLDARPEVVLTDLHPGYAATSLGREWAEARSLPHRAIQHHEAHFAAVLGEHDLLEHPRPVLGFIWDGAGLGHDGQVLGGETFRYAGWQFTRVSQLAYYPHLAGDKLAREPRLSALAVAHGVEEVDELLRPHFSELEWSFYRRSCMRPSRYTSSMGRLFDAVGCLLGLGTHQSYEGMVASRLECLAREGLKAQPAITAYAVKLTDEGHWSARECIRQIAGDCRAQVTPKLIAARFLLTLVTYVEAVAERERGSDLAFSGGVFQNALLVGLLERRLGERYALYFHRQLAPNDENIAYGQLVHYTIQQCRTTPLPATNKNDHVLSYSG